MKVVFAGTPNFACPSLAELIRSQHDVVAVYTQPDRPAGRGKKITLSPVKKLALQHHIPVYQPASLKSRDAELHLRDLAPDVMVVVVYSQILPESILSIPRFGCINVHPSLLPRWRGAAPIQRAILAGDKKTGVTIMQMAKGLDTGDMLLKQTVSIDDHVTSQTLHDQLSALGADMLLDVLGQLGTPELKPEKQDDSKATYAEKMTKAEGLINWKNSSEDIARHVRAFNPWPGTYTHLNNDYLKVLKADVLNKKTELHPGTVVDVQNDAIHIAAGENVLVIKEIQLSGKRAMPVKDFLNAHHDQFVVGKTKLC